MFLSDRNECRDVYDAADVCDNKRGMRLYVDEEDPEKSYCDCMEGWLSYNGICYQDLTEEPDICAKPGFLLRLKAPNLDEYRVFYKDEVESYKLMLSINVSCIKNPCGPSSIPHL